MPSARGATAAAGPDGHPPVRLLSNAQVKKLPTAERKKYKAPLKALEARTQSKADDKTDAGREPASSTRGEVPHFARDSEAASPATASAVTGTSDRQFSIASTLRDFFKDCKASLLRIIGMEDRELRSRTPLSLELACSPISPHQPRALSHAILGARTILVCMHHRRALVVPPN